MMDTVLLDHPQPHLEPEPEPEPVAWPDPAVDALDLKQWEEDELVFTLEM